MTDTAVRWIESKAWELDLYGLPHRIPWPADADPALANETPFDTPTLMRGIEALGPDAGDPWRNFHLAATHFEELAEMLEDNEFPRARQLLDEIEQLHPGTIFTQFHRANVAKYDGEIDKAIALYKAAAERAPRYGFLWNNLGTALAAEGRRDEAVAAFQNAVRAVPNDVTALEGLASLRAAVKVQRDPNDEKSVMYLDIPTFSKMAAEQIPHLAADPDQIFALGEQLLRDGLAPEVATLALEKALEVRPGHPRTLLALAAAYRQSGRHEEARKTVTQFTDSHPEDAAGFVHLAQVENAAGDTDAERRALDRALELDPNLQQALGIRFGLAAGKATEEQERELVAFAEERKAPMALLIASSVARDRGDIPTAVKHAARAHDLAPDSEEVLLHYCAILGEAKDIGRLSVHIEPRVATGTFSKRLAWNFAQALKQSGRTQEAVGVLITAASAEGTTPDFHQAAGATIDFWNGLLIEGGVPLEVTKAATLSRPILLTLDDHDGGVILNAGQSVPCEGKFPLRVPTDGRSETRIALQQGQTGSAVEPLHLGTFIVRGLPPVTGGAHTLQCHAIATPQGSLIFRAVLNNREQRVAWEAATVT